MSKIYGYCRISTNKQNIERQVRNIEEVYPTAIIVKESFTGTKIEGRKEFNKILKVVETGDTIVFDSVSRMSRNAEDGFNLYMDLMDKGINLVFIKERYIDTDVYRQQLNANANIQVQDSDLNDTIMKGIREYLVKILEKQIKIAFEQAEKEVMDLRKRTSEGLETAKRNGKQVGGVKGVKLTTKKSIEKKEQIKKYNKDFNGTLNDTDTIKMIGVTRNTFYKYKKEMLAEIGLGE